MRQASSEQARAVTFGSPVPSVQDQTIGGDKVQLALHEIRQAIGEGRVTDSQQKELVRLVQDASYLVMKRNLAEQGIALEAVRYGWIYQTNEIERSKHDAIVRSINDGITPPPIILLSHADFEFKIVLEGNHRSSAHESLDLDVPSILIRNNADLVHLIRNDAVEIGWLKMYAGERNPLAKALRRLNIRDLLELHPELTEMLKSLEFFAAVSKDSRDASDQLEKLNIKKDVALERVLSNPGGSLFGLGRTSRHRVCVNLRTAATKKCGENILVGADGTILESVPADQGRYMLRNVVTRSRISPDFDRVLACAVNQAGVKAIAGELDGKLSVYSVKSKDYISLEVPDRLESLHVTRGGRILAVVGELDTRTLVEVRTKSIELPSGSRLDRLFTNSLGESYATASYGGEMRIYSVGNSRHFNLSSKLKRAIHHYYDASNANNYIVFANDEGRLTVAQFTAEKCNTYEIGHFEENSNGFHINNAFLGKVRDSGRLSAYNFVRDFWVQIPEEVELEMLPMRSRNGRTIAGVARKSEAGFDKDRGIYDLEEGKYLTLNGASLFFDRTVKVAALPNGDFSGIVRTVDDDSRYILNW